MADETSNTLTTDNPDTEEQPKEETVASDDKAEKKTNPDDKTPSSNPDLEKGKDTGGAEKTEGGENTGGGDEAGGEEKCISPTPSGEDIPQADIDSIISACSDLLQSCQNKADDQKITSLSLSFMLTKIKANLDSYWEEYVPQLNTFLVEADKFTADYYIRMCCTLPNYSEYVKAIDGDDSDAIDNGEGKVVPKAKALDLVNGVVDTYYTAAMVLKSLRGVMNAVNRLTDIRRNVVCDVNTHLPKWMLIQNNVACQLDRIREEAFDTATCINFLKQGETMES